VHAAKGGCNTSLPAAPGAEGSNISSSKAVAGGAKLSVTGGWERCISYTVKLTSKEPSKISWKFLWKYFSLWDSLSSYKMEAVNDGNNVNLKFGVGKDWLLHQGIRRLKKKCFCRAGLRERSGGSHFCCRSWQYILEIPM